MEHTIDQMLKAIERSSEESERLYTSCKELKHRCASLVEENERLKAYSENLKNANVHLSNNLFEEVDIKQILNESLEDK